MGLFDFERAAHTAWATIFSAIILKCCRFHLGQAWYRKIQKLGLAKLYQTECDESDWLKLFFGLAFLKPEEVEDAFVQLMSDLPGNE